MRTEAEFQQEFERVMGLLRRASLIEAQEGTMKHAKSLAKPYKSDKQGVVVRMLEAWHTIVWKFRRWLRVRMCLMDGGHFFSSSEIGYSLNSGTVDYYCTRCYVRICSCALEDCPDQGKVQWLLRFANSIQNPNTTKS